MQGGAARRRWLRVPSQVPDSTAARPTPCHTVGGSPGSSTANSMPKIGTQHEYSAVRAAPGTISARFQTVPPGAVAWPAAVGPPV